MENTKLAKKIAKEMRPEGGWFHDPGTTSDIALAIQSLLDAGIDAEIVSESVSSIICAIQKEYGE